ncbi:type I polyketide synthase [Streptomyces sp. CB09001]|uniref:type I polyketide synthase n=1 Tax=Streptomyces sp. CB09001 TaxID=2083284 RepID=UPI0013BEA658|nr:type I polyketide synthase [Streptomyces sp. CB09001]
MGIGREGTIIAVVGMGCRFPQADSVEEYWSNLVGNRDCVTPVPPERFDVEAFYAPQPGTPGRTVSRYGGFLDDPFAFDPGFFEISPAEAASMDPQHRLLLPVVREALEGAGIRPSALAGTTTGVYMGQATADYAHDSRIETHDLHEATGSHIRAMGSGRVSYDLDLRGPSLTVDTACSSSLVAVHMARQGLLTGETDLAIAGGVNLILSPLDAVAYSQAAMLSPEGRCKFGDTAANGFVRSEGVGIVVLARLSDAQKAGYPVLALLPGSAVTNDGRDSGSLIKPAESGQVTLIERACRDAGITPEELDYVEAHGTGTPVGDAVELRALAALARRRGPERGPLRTGSVKTNIGHTEAAAGIAGLMKAVLIAHHGVVPGSLHLREPQSALTDSDGTVQVVAANHALAAEAEHTLVGVSSFGLSGTNAHVVVAGAEEEETRAPHGRTELPPARPAHLLVLSARSRTALLRLAGDYAGFLAPGGPGNELPLWDICATAALHRDAHPYRLWATGTDHEDLAEALRTLAQGGDTERAGLGEAGFGAARRTVFVFPGQGSQWAGMGQSLWGSTPAFETAITACDAVVRAETGRSVTAALADGTIGDDVAEVQPILWAMEVALAATWQDMGVDPAVCVGHSMGEVAAAAVTGALPLADAAAVICRRSALMRRTVGQGAMMSADVSAEQAADLVAAERNVCVAAENAPSSTILAGDAAALRRIGRRLDRSGIFHRIVRVNVASHSPAMDPIRDDLLAALAGLTPRDGTVPLYSTARDTLLPGSELDAGYWMENLRQPVRFLDGIRHLVKEGDHVFVEVSPHAVLQMAVDDIAREAGAASGVVASTTRKSREEPLALARSLGAFFAMGGTVDWERWFRGEARQVPLPRYSWEREVLRREPAAPLAPAGAGGRVTDVTANLTDATVSLHGFEAIPPVVHLATLHEAVSATAGRSTVTLEQAEVKEPIEPPAGGETTLRVRVAATPGGTVATVHPAHDTTRTALTARVRVEGEPAVEQRHSLTRLDAALARCRTPRTSAQFAEDLADRGYTVGSRVRTLQRLWRRDGEAVALVASPQGSPHVAWESCLLVLLACVPDHAYTVTSFERVRFHRPLTGDVWVRALVTPRDSGRTAVAHVWVLDSQGRPVADFGGIELRRAASPLRGSAPDGLGLARIIRRPARRLVAATRMLRGPRPAQAALAVGIPSPRAGEERSPLADTGDTRATGVGDTGVGDTGVGDTGVGDTGDLFLAQISQVLRLPVERLDLRRSLRDYGIDSLSAAKLRVGFRHVTDRDIALSRLLSDSALKELVSEASSLQPTV